MGEGGGENMDFTTKIAERSEQDLLPLKEDLAEWLSRVLKEKITAENFMDCLENGVLVCKLAQIVQTAARESIKAGKHVKPLAPFTEKFHQNAKSGTFFARDNAAHFLQWCRQIELQDSVLFESDGLVLQKQPREVVLCLLDVARVAADYGIDPPKLIKLEKEIDDEIAAEEQKKPDLKPTKKEKRISKAMSIDAEVRSQYILLCIFNVTERITKYIQLRKVQLSGEVLPGILNYESCPVVIECGTYALPLGLFCIVYLN